MKRSAALDGEPQRAARRFEPDAPCGAADRRALPVVPRGPGVGRGEAAGMRLDPRDQQLLRGQALAAPGRVGTGGRATSSGLERRPAQPRPHDLDGGDLSGGRRLRIRGACERAGLRIDSVFTGLAAYSREPDAGSRTRHSGSGAPSYWSSGDPVCGARSARAASVGMSGSLSRAGCRRSRAPTRALGASSSVRLARPGAARTRTGARRTCWSRTWRATASRGGWPTSSRCWRTPTTTMPRSTLCLDVGHQCAPGATRRGGRPIRLAAALGAADRGWSTCSRATPPATITGHSPPNTTGAGGSAADRVLDALWRTPAPSR